MGKIIFSAALAGAVLAGGSIWAGAAAAQSGDCKCPPASAGAATAQSSIYGVELMSAREMRDYRQRQRQAISLEARQRFDTEHRAKMQALAKERCVYLSPPPPARPLHRQI